MLRSTHKLIAEKIAECLGFSKHNSYIFVDSTLGPDTHGNFPHKTGKDATILQKIGEARQLFFLNDDCAYGELGNALHYIQDTWVDDEVFDETNLIMDDTAFIEKIEHERMPEALKQEYLNTVNMLLKIKSGGIDSWFSHQWGIWHADFASCVYVFADIVEMMLPTLQPDMAVRSDKTKLKQYVHSELFRQATKEGFRASLITNYLDPKIEGYTAAVVALSLIKPPTYQINSEINLQVVYRLSQEIARYTLAEPEQFKHKDSWTNKTNADHTKLGFLKPHYLSLIQRPVSEVRKERLNSFLNEKQKFLCEWPSIQNALISANRGESWKTILPGLIDVLRTIQI